MNITEERLDNFIMKEIVHDITSGTLLLEADNTTLKMMLAHIWEVKEQIQSMGVIIGEA